jgi:hypothetical protein
MVFEKNNLCKNSEQVAICYLKGFQKKRCGGGVGSTGLLGTSDFFNLFFSEKKRRGGYRGLERMFPEWNMYNNLQIIEYNLYPVMLSCQRKKNKASRIPHTWFLLTTGFEHGIVNTWSIPVKRLVTP